MVHRALATLLALLTLNVSAAEALRACAKDAGHEPAAHVAQQAADPHAHHRASASVPAPSDKDCEKPVNAPRTCCDALSSCGTTLVIDGAGDEQRVTPVRPAMASGDDRAHSALAGTPEPPPPKG